jgi:hypothetical protein
VFFSSQSALSPCPFSLNPVFFSLLKKTAPSGAREINLDSMFDLESKPLARALISFAVKSTGATAAAPATHRDWLQVGVTETAYYISDTSLRLQGRSSISSSAALPGDAPVIIGFSLFIMLGIIQAVSKEGISLDVKELTERLIERHLYQRADNDQAARKEILEISRIATRIPGQIVETAKGEVEELFSRCYSVIPAFVQGSDETRVQLMPIFGTALHVLLQAQVQPNRALWND